MPEIEIPHGEGGKNEKPVGIVIAVLAVIMAIFGSLGNNAANERIVAEVKASNGYSWYQAKRQRAYVGGLEIKRLAIDLDGNPTSAQKADIEKFITELKSKNETYEKEGTEIQVEAKRNAAEAKIHAERNDGFDHAELALQVSVVLCTLTLLTGSKLFMRVGLLVATAGIILGSITLTKSIGAAAVEAIKDAEAEFVKPAK